MIEHIRTKGFKGFDLDEPVPQKVVYSGKNKRGKSTRAGAICLALYGYIPFSTAGKKPGDILDSFGGDSIVSVVKIGGTEFGRKFSRNPKTGGASQSVQVDGKRSSAENFAILLDRAGAPRIANVTEFMKQSEAKKIDTLFDLFPNPDLANIDTEIEEAKEDVSRIEKLKNSAESVVVHLTKSKSDIKIPAGSIAEVQSEINKIEIQITELSEEIKQAEIEEAKEKAKEEERIKADKEAAGKIEKAKEDGKLEGKRLEKERADKKEASVKVVNQDGVDFETKTFVPSDDQLKTDADWKNAGIDEIETSPEMQELDKTISGLEKQVDGFNAKTGEIQEDFLPGDDLISPELTDREFFQSPGQQKPASDAIQNIINALVGAGCGTCAALIVAKKELKKFKEVS